MLLVFSILACSNPDPAPAAPAPVAAPATSPAPAATRSSGRAAPNRPPRIERIALAPEAPVATDTLVATVNAADPENDPLDLDFTWYVNDIEVLGVASESLSGRFEKGDRVRVRVTAQDATNETTEEGPTVTVANRAPVFETGPADMKKVDGFRFRASDPDGDALRWRLEGAPAGMTISADGRLAYKGSETEPGGNYTVAVVVEDGEAFGRFEFPLTVSPGSRAQAAK